MRKNNMIEDADGGCDERRRRVLKLTGTAALTGLAGCSDLQRYEASPIALDDNGPAAQYTLEEATQPTRTLSPSVVAGELTIESHAASYHRDGDGFLSDVGVGLLATPPVREAGQTLNSLASQSLDDVLTSDVGQPLVADLGVESGWATAPSKLDDRSGTVLGTETTVETFVGRSNDDEVALVSLTRIEHEGDAVLVGDGRTRPLAEGEESQPASQLVSTNEHREAGQSFVDLLPHVVRESPGDAGTGSSTPEGGPDARVPIGSVPGPIRRRAARFVERAAGEEATWPTSAELGEVAHRVTRPDIDGVAYYEIEVEPTGFVLAATDEHDAPIPHWNADSRSIGRVLEERAEDGQLARVVWIDRLRYVGEDSDGNSVATRGRAVPRIENAEALADVPDTVTSVRYGPAEEVDDDGQVSEDDEMARLRAENQHPPPDISFAEWESHDQLKANYEASYGPLLADLRERAAAVWERYRERSGESQRIGTDRATNEPLLADQRVAAIDETDRDAFRVERNAREVGHDLLSIAPTGAASADETLRFVLEGAGSEETIEYRAVDPDDDPVDPVELDVVESAEPARGNSTFRSTEWAGGAGLQPWYHQFDYQGCPVGCGPVAWAILFGWVDRQADGGRFNGTWWPRWGIYRQQGGYGADAVAPINHDSNPVLTSNGVRSMIEELSDDLNVVCVGDNGATVPWAMDGARDYLSGRTGTDLDIHFHSGGFSKPRCEVAAARSIRGDANGKGPTPLVVGKGFLSHYPVAYAFRDGFWNNHVKVNNGWGPNHDERTEWIWADSWFSGETYP